MDLVAFADQRKFLIKSSMWLDIDLGRGKTLEMWVAKLLKTCLTRTLRPAKDRSLDFHTTILEKNLSNKGLKCCLLGVPMVRE